MQTDSAVRQMDLLCYVVCGIAHLGQTGAGYFTETVSVLMLFWDPL